MSDGSYPELVVAACCAASREGARHAHQHLTADDFTTPAFRAIFQASINLADHPLPTLEQAVVYEHARLRGEHPASPYPSERRLQELAGRLGTTVADLEQLTALRPVHADISGRYAQQVKAAARTRRHRAGVLELHQLLNSSLAGDQQRAAILADQLAQQLSEAN